MHQEASNFLLFVKQNFPDYFNNKTVLDVGSGDINGNNVHLFDKCIYNGNDVISAPNVTIVSRTKDLPFNDNYFDTIISSECFEHDPEYIQSWEKIYKMLKPNGLFVFTCASTGRPEHGTLRTSIQESYGTRAKIEDMQNYYKNLTEKDLNDVLDLKNSFSKWNSYYNSSSYDLYFIGIKKDDTPLPIYNESYVENTTANII